MYIYTYTEILKIENPDYALILEDFRKQAIVCHRNRESFPDG